MTVALSPETDFDWWLKSREVGETKEKAFDYQSIIALNDKKALS